MPSLRSLLRIALVGCLVLSTQGLLLVQGTFLLRHDFVVSRLCVNRTPECDGKCFLTKQLREQREREREQGAASLEVMLAVGSLLTASDVLAVPEAPAHGFQARPERPLRSRTPDEVFHPPRG